MFYLYPKSLEMDKVNATGHYRMFASFLNRDRLKYGHCEKHSMEYYHYSDYNTRKQKNTCSK